TTNIFDDPLFVNDSEDDFHLKSNSPCIDRGDPTDEFENEPEPNGGRINMGAYGNTPEATLSFDVIAQQDFAADTTWEGYVNVINNISTNGYSLTVEPGTKVLFDDGKSLSISGDFTSDGQPNIQDPPDSIEFSGYRKTDIMGGVFIDGDGGGLNTVRYSSFSRSDIGFYLRSVIYQEDVFEHLLFKNNDTGLYLSDSDMEITSSTFQNNETGIISDYSNLVLSESVLSSNDKQG
ncbi:MAG: hypothetical protein GWN00_35740, partial [Aliifodinibius sp.]|nr:hypothetical protein [Fodinibius sp.]NIV15983.1 hypothetical protein [Fodinibius sp.]NIY29950.1 hypothetical protein [Fodinibius sp.]